MNAIQVEQKSYEMPPREGISIAQFLTVADIERSARYYEKVFGARILSLATPGRTAAALQVPPDLTEYLTPPLMTQTTTAVPSLPSPTCGCR